MSKILDGRKLSEKILSELKEEISKQSTKPGLSIILVGKNPASVIYVSKKEKACEKLGMNFVKHDLDENVKEEEIISLIKNINKDNDFHGILVQLPLPKHLNEERILSEISPVKDVDGLHPINLGKLLKGEDALLPCTPKGIIKLLEEYNIDLEGKEVVIVNHSNIVGKPLSLMMLNKNATVTICNVKTKNLASHTKNADILVTATGVPNLIKGSMVKKDSIVIDAGIAMNEKKIVGDVDFENVSKIASYITPVPGSVGPMTVAMVMENTLLAMKKQLSES